MRMLRDYNNGDNGLWTAFILAVLAALLIILTGCTKTQYVSVPEIHTEYINKTDSFIRTDSVFQDRNVYIKGDTVFQTERVYKYQNVYIPKYSTIYKTDSIPYPVEVEKRVEVEKKLSWWQKLRQWLGGAVIMAAIGAGVFWYVKKKDLIINSCLFLFLVNLI